MVPDSGFLAVLKTFSICFCNNGVTSPNSFFANSIASSIFLIPPDLIQGQSITEVFGYWCNACFSFESTVKKMKEQRQDVNVVQIPAGNEVYARLYYTIISMGLGEEAHLNVYKDIQLLRKNLSNKNDVLEFARRHGYDEIKFMNVYNSFGIGIKAQNALRTVRSLANAGVLEGVPTIVINGKYKFRRTGDVQRNIDNMLFLYDN